MSRCRICDYCETAPSLSNDLGQGYRRKHVVYSATLKDFYCRECLSAVVENHRLYRGELADKENKTLPRDKLILDTKEAYSDEIKDRKSALALSDV